MIFWLHHPSNIKFAAKMPAIMYTQMHGGSLDWYFYDDQFSKVNWMQPSYKSIDTLYEERAKQLRDEHDYLVLFLSGGVDSINALMAFDRANAMVDEVLMTGAFSADSSTKDDTNANLEVYKTTTYYLNQLKNKPKVIRFEDLTKYNHLYNFDPAEWVLSTGSHFNIRIMFLYEAFDLLYKTEREKYSSFAGVWGMDKPRVHFNSKTNRFSAFFLDEFTINTINMQKNPIDNKSDRICFYWDPKAADVLVKQSHMVKDYYKIRNEQHKLNISQFDQKFYERNIAKIIYPSLQHSLFLGGKSVSKFQSRFDTYFFTKPHDWNKLKIMHADVETWYRNNIRQEWWNDANNMKTGPKVLPSKFYDLGE